MKKKKTKLKNIISIIVIAILSIIIIGIFAFAILLTKYSKDLPDPNKLIERSIPQSTKIYDKTGEVLLYEVHGNEKRTIVELDNISKNLINATLSAEDKNFYKHKGLDFKGILRGLFKTYILGKPSQSGSTLTQQLVKNAILTNEKTIERKIKEWILTYKIEQRFSKDEILKMYLNEIPYGSVVYGIEAASETFFGKKAKDLTIEESALLAALPQAPTTLSPYKENNENLAWRYKYVLGQMKANGYITEEEYNKAINYNIISEIKPRNETMLAPHFVMYIKQQLEEKYGEQVVEEGGLTVITTLDYDKQKKAEEIISSNASSLEKKYNANNAALLSINTKTGEIEAMVGSKDYYNKDFGAFNVTINKRQLGSSFKPVVYVAAFQKGFTPDTVLFDAITNFNGYEPKNYTLKEYGPVSMRKALAGSLNIPAVKTLYLTGIDNVIKLAQSLGYSTISLKDKDQYGLTLALGTIEAPMIDHVQAFSVFANAGVKRNLKSILLVKDENNKILEDNTAIEQGTRVLDKNIANEINSILSDNDSRAFIFGAKNNLTLKNRQVAAKTGTTNDYKDTWTIGYTPNIVTAVWVGNNDNKEMNKASASMLSAPLWQEYMEYSTKNDKQETFEQPKYENKKNMMLNGSWINTKIVKIDSLSGKLASDFTPQELIKERQYIDLHSILHYIDKNDLSKEVIESPNDPEYPTWEEGVKTWFNNLINKQNKTQEDTDFINNLLKQTGNEGLDIKDCIIDKIPTEIDTTHTQDAITSVKIISPENNIQNTSNQITVKIAYTTTNQIVKVNYLVDGILLLSKTTEPFDENTISLLNIDSGEHILEVRVFDQFLNTKSDSIKFTQITSGLSVNLSSDKTIYNLKDTIPLNLFISNINLINTIRIFYEVGGNKYLLSQITDPDTNIIKVFLNPQIPSSIYKVYAEIQKNNNETMMSNILNIQVN
ncbi:PBP1A family penicillin-binding protein [Patescibacteria group bacterium]|nr:PBP1A family penicillin-binding protein [Patescibacteria group bacterium]